jgi:hypothetical protein
VVPLADDLAEPHFETGLFFDFTDSGVWRLLSGLDFPGDETPWGLPSLRAVISTPRREVTIAATMGCRVSAARVPYASSSICRISASISRATRPRRAWRLDPFCPFPAGLRRPGVFGPCCPARLMDLTMYLMKASAGPAAVAMDQEDHAGENVLPCAAFGLLLVQGVDRVDLAEDPVNQDPGGGWP